MNNVEPIKPGIEPIKSNIVSIVSPEEICRLLNISHDLDGSFVIMFRKNKITSIGTVFDFDNVTSVRLREALCSGIQHSYLFDYEEVEEEK